jgi:plasmid stabilization system protein ParE
MKFHVHLTDNAKGDIRAILRWLESRSPAGAEAWYRKWLDALETLRERADSLGLAPESDDHPTPIRQILFKTRRGRFYRALFAVRELEVFVLHVRGPGQDLIQSQQKS